MNENDKIDELFRNGIQKDYPFDEGLWSSLETQLNNPSSKRTLWSFNLNTIALFLVLLCCSLIPTDSVKSDGITDSTITASTLPTSNQIKSGNPKPTYSHKKNSATTAVQKSKSSYKSVDDLDISKSNELPKNSHKTAVLRQESKAITVHKKELNHALRANEDNLNLNSTHKTNSLFSTLGTNIKMDFMELSSLMPFSKQQAEPANVDLDLNNMQQNLKPNFYYIEVEVYRSVQLTKKISGANQALLDYKKESESPLFRQSIGINVLRDYKSFTMGIGIHYSKFIERANYAIDGETKRYETVYDTNYRLINGNYTSNGNAVLLIKEEINSSQIEKSVKTTNQLAVQNEFKRMQVPIILGYQKNFGSWMASLQAAFVFNYLIESNGLYVNEDQINFDSFDESNQLKQLMYSQKNQASIGFLVNEAVLVGGRFSYEYDLNSYTTDYNSKFQSYNLGIWLQWKP